MWQIKRRTAPYGGPMVNVAKAEISPKELKRRLDAGEKLPLVDVREPHELAICKLDGNIHIPMNQLPTRMNELEKYKGEEVIVYCRSGGRSGQCVQYLRNAGFNAVNLTGGILAWSDDVDSSVTKY